MTKPFSIHKRIEVGETALREHAVFIAEPLSVSTNGSRWVKPVRAARADFCCFPFSIHKRIEVGETMADEKETKAVGDFQYPQTDRGG